ncbi:recombinase family protein [Geodermatophilus sp. SYSU D00758]
MAWRHGAAVFTVESGEVLQDDPDDPMRTALQQIVGAFAELDRRMIAKRLRDGRLHKRDAGGYAGGRPPYGWRAEDGALVEDPAEQATIRLTRELRASGLSLRQTVTQLAAQGLTNRQGGTWHSAALGRVLDR